MSLFYNHFEETIVLYKILSLYMTNYDLSLIISTRVLSNNISNLKANISCSDNKEVLKDILDKFNNTSFIIFDRYLKCKINLLKNNTINIIVTKR